MPDDASTLHEVIDELSAILDDERQALRKLDGGSLDGATTRKIACTARLEQLARGARTAGLEVRAALDRVRRAARTNAILAAHARACVRGALLLASGQTPSSYPEPPGHGAARGIALRVDVRG